MFGVLADQQGRHTLDLCQGLRGCAEVWRIGAAQAIIGLDCYDEFGQVQAATFLIDGNSWTEIIQLISVGLYRYPFDNAHGFTLL